MRRSALFLIVLAVWVAVMPAHAAVESQVSARIRQRAEAASAWFFRIQTPQVSAQSYIAVDLTTGRILLTRGEHDHRAPASLTKMMSAWVALKEAGPDTVVAVDWTATQIDEKKVGLGVGELISVDSLVRAALIGSGNDAAMALGLVNDYNRPVFIEKMNQQARDWGMTDTTFMNTVGVDADGHLSSVHDMAVLSLHLLSDPYFRDIVQMREDTVYSADGKSRHFLKNTNSLLQASDAIKGIKTGITDQAGGTLSLLGERNGRQILVVLFGSQDRFTDGQSLMDWAYANTAWVELRMPVLKVPDLRDLLFVDPFHLSWRTAGTYSTIRL